MIAFDYTLSADLKMNKSTVRMNDPLFRKDVILNTHDVQFITIDYSSWVIAGE